MYHYLTVVQSLKSKGTDDTNDLDRMHLCRQEYQEELRLALFGLNGRDEVCSKNWNVVPLVCRATTVQKGKEFLLRLMYYTYCVEIFHFLPYNHQLPLFWCFYGFPWDFKPLWNTSMYRWYFSLSWHSDLHFLLSERRSAFNTRSGVRKGKLPMLIQQHCHA